MKKIIIMFMAISMLLVSCRINVPVDDVSVTTPSNPTTPTTTSTDDGSDDSDDTSSTDSQPTQYTVTFNSNGGSSVDSQTVAPNGHATRPTNPTKDDCEFAYWYSTNESVEYNFNTATITDNITLYAKWYMHYFELENNEDVYDFTYKVNNGDATLTPNGNNYTLWFDDNNACMNVEKTNNKVKFTHNHLHNVTVNRTTNIVSIELSNW